MIERPRVDAQDDKESAKNGSGDTDATAQLVFVRRVDEVRGETCRGFHSWPFENRLPLKFWERIDEGQILHTE
jgi:hypothetical protein